MPKVPTLDPNRIQEQSIQPTQSFKGADSSAFGVGMGQATSTAVNQATDEFLKQKLAADKIRVLEADKDLSALETEALYGKEGALMQRGKNAIGAKERTLEIYKKRHDDIIKGLSNSQQKDLFSQMYQTRVGDIDKKITAHESKEIAAYDNDVTKAYVGNEQEAAVASYNDPQRVKAAITRQTMELEAWAKRNGLEGDVANQRIADELSKTHTMIISRHMTEKDDGGARDYFEKNKAFMTAKDVDATTKALKVSETRGAAERAVDDIMSKNLSMKEALKLARKSGKNDETEDEVVKRLKTRYSEKNQERDMLQKDLYEGESAKLEKAGGRYEVPENKWLSMSPSNRVSFEKRAKVLRGEVDATTNWKKYYDWEHLYANPKTRHLFLKVPMAELRANLSDTDFKKFSAMHSGLKKGDTSIADGAMSDIQVIDDTFISMGFSKKDNSDKYVLYREKIDNRIAKWKAENGNSKQIPNKVLREITDDLRIEATRDSGWWFIPDSSVRGFEIKPGEEVQLSVDKVPAKDRMMIEEALKRKNKPVTTENILKLYGKKVGLSNAD